MTTFAPEMSAPWYRIDDLDREGEVVWLRRVSGRIAKGVMRLHRRHGQKFSVVGLDGRTLEPVPYYSKPGLWQPLDPRRWGVLPHPAVVQPEPEADPMSPPANARGHAPAGEVPLPSAIAYSDGGGIGRSECEARLLRALMTDRALPDTDRAKMKVRAQWPATGYGPGDWPPEINLRWRPFPEDVADYLTAMAWFARLQQFDRKLIRLRAQGWSFRRMTEELRHERGGHSDEWARLRYAEAIDRAWRISNGT